MGDAPADDDDVGPFHPAACPDIVVPAELADAVVVAGICCPGLVLAAPEPAMAANALPDALEVLAEDCVAITAAAEDVGDAIEVAVDAAAAGPVVLAAALVDAVAVAWICCTVLVDSNTGAVVVT